MKKIFGLLLCIVMLLNIFPATNVFAVDTAVWDGTIATSFAGGNGTKEKPYLITNGSQLAYLLYGYNDYYADENTYYEITCDIYLNDKNSFLFNENGFVTEIKSNVDIRTWQASDMGVYGKLDGNNHTIYGLYCDGSTSKSSLFGSIRKGIIENLNIGYGYIIGGYSGTACAFGNTSNNATIRNCINYSTITGYSTELAGISSINYGIIDMCENYGTVGPAANDNNTSRSVGGIANYNTGSISNSKNHGAISGHSYLGGIVGQNQGIVAGCENSGSIYNGWDTGGIVGSNSGDGYINSCINSGYINGGRSGGIAGATYAVIENCFNTGTIESSNKGGGLIGQIYDNTTTQNCISIGKYQGAVTNIFGSVWSNSIISDCYYATDITGEGENGIGVTLEEINSETFITKLNDFVANSNSEFIQYWVRGENAPKFAEESDLITISSSSNGGGKILPLGNKSVLKGYGASYNIIPNYGYIIEDVFVNGISIGKVSSYKFNNITANSTISVVFKENGLVANSYAGGSGTETDPYQIATANQLRRLTQQVNLGNEQYDYYVLTEDIVLNTPDKFLYDVNGKVTGPNPDNMPEEWVPIGSDERFYGHLDGNAHTISGLYINKPDTSNMGLIGYTNSDVYNINLSYGYISGEGDCGAIAGNVSNVYNCQNENVTMYCTTGYIGGVAGWASGVYNCSNNANVNGSDWVGGVAGHSGIASDCTNYGNVIATHVYPAGITGSGCNLYECFNYGNICGPSAAGLIGEASGNEIINCVNYGEISGNGCGGFIGRVDRSYTIINCLSVGKVINGVADIYSDLNNSYIEIKNSYNVSSKTTAITNYIKDLSNDNYISTKIIIDLNKEVQNLNDSSLRYWTSDSETKAPKLTDRKDVFNVKVKCLAGGTVEPYTSITMLAGSSFEIKFIPDEGNVIHSITVNGENVTKQDVYNVESLKENTEIEVKFADNTGKVVTGFNDGTGSKDSPFIISTPDQLNALAERVNNEYTDYDGYYIALGCNIDMTNVDYHPIGKDSHRQFQGVFDGNSYAVQNLNFESTYDNSGLFGVVGANAVITNLNLSNATLTSEHNNIGLIAGNNSGKISACNVTSSTITPGDGQKIGGIVGINFGVIENSTNESNIIDGNEYLGGIAGHNMGSVFRCKNNGSIENTNGNGGQIGGICGYSSGKVRWCENTGDIIASGFYASDCAGIVGCIGSNCDYSASMEEFAYIKNCVNKGKIIGPCYIGGIAGSQDSYESFIWDCENYGEIQATNLNSYNIGGIIGLGYGDGNRHGVYEDIFEPFIKNCMNYSTVSGQDAVGGIVGFSHTKIDSCFNYGSVLGEGNIGGIIGKSEFLALNCGNYGDVCGEKAVGGVVGNNTSFLLNSYNRGTVEGLENTGGIVGRNAYDYDYEHEYSIYNCYNSGLIKSDCGGSCIGYNAFDSNIFSVYSLPNCADVTIYRYDNQVTLEEVSEDKLLGLLNNGLKEYVPLEGEQASNWLLDDESLPSLKLQDGTVLEIISQEKTNTGYSFKVSLSLEESINFDTGVLIIALYNNEKFIGMASCPISNADTSKTLSILTNSNATTAKAMLWKDYFSLIPLCNTFETKIKTD